MRISIVVPTRDRPEALARCLAALDFEHEVVVVDDGSRDRPAIASALETRPGTRLVRAPGRGPATARNVGARAAKGEVVCFTDDDCEPGPGWAETLAAVAGGAGAAAGRTVPPPGAPAVVRASQAIVEHLMLSSLAADGGLGFAPSCNLAIARESLGALPFDERFPSAAGEDRDWSDRAASAGVAPVYVPEAVVVHRQVLGPTGFARQQYAYGRGAARYRAAGSGRSVSRPWFYAELVRRGFGGGLAVGGLVVAAQGLTAAGVVAERLSALGGGRA
jgi:glycosyltransferase involved in cell wall biosynthesis